MIDLAELGWRKSSWSDNGHGGCVEVADLPGGVRGVRDTKQHGRGPVLWITAGAWEAFTEGVKGGQFD